MVENPARCKCCGHEKEETDHSSVEDGSTIQPVVKEHEDRGRRHYRGNDGRPTKPPDLVDYTRHILSLAFTTGQS